MYRNNEVWVFNFIDLTWQRKHTSNKRPNPRYGQTQVALVTKNSTCNYCMIYHDINRKEDFLVYFIIFLS